MSKPQRTEPVFDLTETLKNAGACQTIYSFIMPETEAMIDKLLSEDSRPHYHNRYRHAWTSKQDSTHEEFFATWLDWTKDVVGLDTKVFPHSYPTAGASEALREAIYSYGAKARADGFLPTIHVFEGEYEGFAAYAEAAGIPVQKHNRDNWQHSLPDIGPNDQFYISQPSAIDGNIWHDYDQFADALYAQHPQTQLMVDLTYVGAVWKPFHITVNRPNVETVFFSLSKPMGVYYHRIGGCFSRHAYPGLFGNKWFKNLFSLALGTELMQYYDVHALAQKYRELAQIPALKRIQKDLGIDGFEASDAFLLAHKNMDGLPASILEDGLIRDGTTTARLCLTPTMAKIAGMI